ncbi:thioredoxin family protein [Rhodopirellula sp. MGV]|uniref:thioredoxin family protein n=1 Tax=Rhodopirellula sp. MGV TaxID=2023130 RepID=UPI000B96741E|nr:thioredoxin family protein [Rhodopirellula sp. MGV]OYP39237.1 thioredoxin family protein [Rhodopirellula sp. MGV]
MKSLISLLMLLTILIPQLLAGEYNPTVSVGEVLASWSDLPGIDGETHSWNDLKDKKAVIVAFTCNTCPYAVEYETRLKQLATKWAKDERVALVAVNSNLVEEDSLEAMQEKGKAAQFDFPYFKDEKQELGKAWGATRTPEFFVLDRERKVVYMGALDDDTNAEKATRNYVNEAVEAILAGKKPEVQETVPIGCNIRYKRSRRR